MAGNANDSGIGGPMKLFPIMLLTAVSVTYLFSQGAPQSSRQTGIVQGVVTRDGTNDPIPDVQVTVGVIGGPGIVTVTGPTGELLTITPENGQQLLDAASRGAARGLPQEILDAAQQAARGNSPNGSTPPPPLIATTDSAGHFTISGVPAGNVTVRAQLQGYFGPATNGNYPGIVSGNATVSADKPADVHLAMIPGGTISGRVFDPAGKPLSDTPVQVLRRAYNSGAATLQTVNLKSTDDHGDYRMYRLPPGEYFLVASPQRLPSAFSKTAATSNEVPIATLYPGAVDTSAAVPIVLRGGDEITGINIPIKTATTSTISGRIVISVPSDQVNTAAIQRGNVPAAVPTVMLARRESVGVDINGGGGSVFNPDDGTFVFRNVPSGSYVVVARLPVTANNGWGPQNTPERATGPIAFGRTAVVVNGSDVKDVAVVVHKGVDLSGVLIVDGRPAAANLRISLQADDSDLSLDGPTGNTLNQISSFNPMIETGGAFKIPLLPEGRYRVQVYFGAGANPGGRGQAPAPATPSAPQLPATTYLSDVRQGGTSVYDNGLTIGNQASEPIEILVNTNAGSIQGSVLGPDQKPVPSTTVVLVPQESRRQNPALYKTARTDAQGHFVINTVPPGPYTLFAWESVLTGAWQNAEFLRSYADRGVPVSVSAAERANVEVGLIKDRR
jgi:protocatechuate 3,4-dioxygenase beta subunit